MDPFEYLDGLGQFRMVAGLGRMERLMGALGEPHLSTPTVLVGGTNGKGSTCSMIDSILSSFPINREVYTSPHLTDITERITFNGVSIERDVLGETISGLKDISEKIFATKEEGPTYFELLTASAMEVAVSKGADILISEVGLGGRLDATNILEPQAVALTSVSLDHTRILGEEPSEIAREKGGIIKPSTPVVIGPICRNLPGRERCLRAILEICTHNGSPVLILTGEEGSKIARDLLRSYILPEWEVVSVKASSGKGGTSAVFEVLDGEGNRDRTNIGLVTEILEGEYRIPLLGKHQAFNSGTAVALSILSLPSSMAHSRLRRGKDEGLEKLFMGEVEDLLGIYPAKMLRRMISEGLLSTRLPGRMELRNISGKDILIDGGHNQEAGQALADTLDEVFGDRKAVMLLAMMGDKDPSQFTFPLEGRISESIVTSYGGERSMEPEMMVDGITKGMEDDSTIHIRKDLREALEIWFDGIPRKGLGVACGSFYTYKELDRFLRSRNEDHAKTE